MNPKRHVTLALCTLLSLGLLEGPFAQRAFASGMITTGDAVSVLSGEQQRAKVDALLQRQDVRDGLQRFGVSAEEASMRIAALSDSEIRTLADKIEAAPAGGDVLVISLTTILLVVLILILLGKI
jgi:tellurite resistance protein